MKGIALQSYINGRWEWWTLSPDTSISIEMQSPIFGNGAMFSYPFKVPVEPNRHILGNADQLHGARLHKLVHKSPTRLWLCGLPFRKGILRLDNEVKITPSGELEMEMTSERGEWDERIEGMNARDVEIRDDILIGVALDRESRTSELRFDAETSIKLALGNTSFLKENGAYSVITNVVAGSYKTKLRNIKLEQVEGNGQKWPKYVLNRGRFGAAYSGGKELDLTASPAYNLTEPYNPKNPEAHPFCNIRVCYQKHELRATNGDYTEQAARGYSVAGNPSPMDSKARLPYAAPNFFVLYWLYRLFKTMKVDVASNALEDIEDMRRLFFVNTRIAYDETPTYNGSYSQEKYGLYAFGRSNIWSDTYLPVGDDKTKAVGSIIDNKSSYATTVKVLSLDRYIPPQALAALQNNGITLDQSAFFSALSVNLSGNAADNTEGHFKLKVSRFQSNGDEGFRRLSIEGYGHKAFATTDNLPNEEVGTILENLEKAFGCRFIFNDSQTQVRVVLLRDILRETSYTELAADVRAVSKTESNITGFRLTYGDSDNYSISSVLLETQSARITSSSQYRQAAGTEAKQAIFNSYALKAIGERLRSNVSYAKLINSITSFDKTLYYTPTNGNMYAIKVDKDAKGYADLHASLFEVLQFVPAEDGDCSLSDNTEEISIGFTPAEMNDVAVEDERAGLRSTQQFALFADAEMKTRYSDRETSVTTSVGDRTVEQWGLMAVTGDGWFSQTVQGRVGVRIYAAVEGENPGWHVDIPVTARLQIEGVINEGPVLHLEDNYEPNDSGESPLESIDWGTTLCVMRGGGNDAAVVYYDDNYDGEGNSRWTVSAGGDYASHSDACDSYGNKWDYNGTSPGLQDNANETDDENAGKPTGRFSLKLRAEKPNPKFDSTKPESSTNSRYLPITDSLNQRRGLADVFYSEYSHFVRNRKLATLDCTMELAEIMRIDLTKRYKIGDIIGWINNVKFTADADGISNVNVEMYYL